MKTLERDKNTSQQTEETSLITVCEGKKTNKPGVCFSSYFWLFVFFCNGTIRQNTMLNQRSRRSFKGSRLNPWRDNKGKVQAADNCKEKHKQAYGAAFIFKTCPILCRSRALEHFSIFYQGLLDRSHFSFLLSFFFFFVPLLDSEFYQFTAKQKLLE